MRAWFQKTLSTQSPAVAAVLHNIRRLREQHAWFPLTKHQRVEERSFRVAAKQRELPLPLNLHTDKTAPQSSIEEMYAYLLPLRQRRIILYVGAVIVVAWFVGFYLSTITNRTPSPRQDVRSESRVFNLSFAPVFLYESLALEMAYQALSQLGYQVNKWSPVELVDTPPVKPPDDSTDVYLLRTALNAGFITFTNTAGRERIITFHLTNNIVSCEVHEMLAKK